MIVERIVLHEYELPLVSPFSTSVRTIESLPRILVELRTDEGIAGIGECAPNYEVTGENGAGTAELVENVIAPIVVGSNPLHAEQIRNELSVVHGAPAAHAGVDMALCDLLAKHADLPLYQYLGGADDAPSVTVPNVVSMAAPEEMASEAARGVEAGHDQIKIKVGDDPATDERRIRAVDDAIPDEVSLKADANQGWSDAKTSLRVLSAVGDRLDAIEQPVHEDAIDDLRMVRDRTDVPVMADEPVRTPRDAMNLIKREAADMLNIKLMKAGGISPAVRLNAVAAADGRPTQLGSMLEGEVGTAAGVHYVAALDNVVWNELVGPLLTEGRFTDLSVEGPELATDGPGLGVSIDRDALASLRTNRRVVA
jgi:L-alanine-DL-glutamate epimerase-like enolase superfamily enzyme